MNETAETNRHFENINLYMPRRDDVSAVSCTGKPYIYTSSLRGNLTPNGEIREACFKTCLRIDFALHF
jgi:hypothetical protein